MRYDIYTHIYICIYMSLSTKVLKCSEATCYIYSNSRGRVYIGQSSQYCSFSLVWTIPRYRIFLRLTVVFLDFQCRKILWVPWIGPEYATYRVCKK